MWLIFDIGITGCTDIGLKGDNSKRGWGMLALHTPSLDGIKITSFRQQDEFNQISRAIIKIKGIKPLKWKVRDSYSKLRLSRQYQLSINQKWSLSEMVSLCTACLCCMSKLHVSVVGPSTRVKNNCFCGHHWPGHNKREFRMDNA